MKVIEGELSSIQSNYTLKIKVYECIENNTGLVSVKQ